MIYFISYDIADDKRRRRATKTLANYGIRVQLSFFECEMEETQKDGLAASLLEIIDKEEDSLLIYPLCQKCLSATFTEGRSDMFRPVTYMVI